MEEIAFDDIEALNAAISEEWSDWGPEFELSQEKINSFADLTGDHQWIHIDEEKAKAGPFGTTIAHGFFTLSLVPVLSLMLEGSSGARLKGFQNVINYGGDRLRFLAPVPAGSTVHARTRMKEAKEHKAGTLILTEIAIHVNGSETPSVLYDSLSLFQG